MMRGKEMEQILGVHHPPCPPPQVSATVSNDRENAVLTIQYCALGTVTDGGPKAN